MCATVTLRQGVVKRLLDGAPCPPPSPPSPPLLLSSIASLSTYSSCSTCVRCPVPDPGVCGPSQPE